MKADHPGKNDDNKLAVLDMKFWHVNVVTVWHAGEMGDQKGLAGNLMLSTSMHASSALKIIRQFILAKLPEISIPGGGNMQGTMRKEKLSPSSINTKRRNTMECYQSFILLPRLPFQTNC